VGFNTLPYEEYMSVYEAELRNLGGEVTRQNNLIRSDAINFVFGSYYLQDVFSHHHPTMDWYGPFVDQLIHNPGNVIFCNLEQVTPGSAIFGSGHLHLLRQAFIFDYSHHNIEAFNRFGFHNTKLVHPLYSSFLDKQATDTELTTDILFTGAITSHRQAIIDRIEAETGRKISYFHYNLWGDDLHREILKSRIILNIKGWPENRSFEALRCLFPLCNGKTIISEISAATDIHPLFKDSIISGSADELPALCKQALENEAATQAATDARIAHFKQIPFKDALQAGLDAFYAHHQAQTPVPWRVRTPTQIVLGPQADGLWNYESLHIDLMAQNGVDLIWHPDEPFPFQHTQRTVRFGDLNLQPGSMHKIEANYFLAGTRNLVPCMKALLDLLVVDGELSLTLPFGDAAWELPYAVRAFNFNSLQPFLGLNVKKLGWTGHTFEQVQLSYIPTPHGSDVLAQYAGDVTKWAQAPGTVHSLAVRLVKKALSDDSHPYDLDYLARYAGN